MGAGKEYAETMKLTWYGHASFRVTAEDGRSVVTDPYDPATSGYKPVTEPADVVVISSATDSFHCNAQLVPGEPVVVNSLELARSGAPRTVQGLTFYGIEAAEAPDHHEGHPEANGMVRFMVDGLSVGHMGDVGTPLSEAQLEFFGGIDVLLALAGGHPTIPLDALRNAVDRIKPKLVVPMHFDTPLYKLGNLEPVDVFLSHVEDIETKVAGSCEVHVTPADLPEKTQVLVLEPFGLGER